MVIQGASAPGQNPAYRPSARLTQERTSMTDDGEITEALVLMVDHYLGRGEGILDDMCMSPGETALSVLVKKGLAKWEPQGFRFAVWTEAGQSLLDDWHARKHARMAADIASEKG